MVFIDKWSLFGRYTLLFNQGTVTEVWPLFTRWSLFGGLTGQKHYSHQIQFFFSPIFIEKLFVKLVTKKILMRYKKSKDYQS